MASEAAHVGAYRWLEKCQCGSAGEALKRIAENSRRLRLSDETALIDAASAINMPKTETDYLKSLANVAGFKGRARDLNIAVACAFVAAGGNLSPALNRVILSLTGDL